MQKVIAVTILIAANNTLLGVWPMLPLTVRRGPTCHKILTLMQSALASR